jgi:hypothetical protein
VARSTFGGRPGDFTIVDPSTTSNVVTVAPSVTGATVWSAKTGGTQYTDLLVGGTPATTVSSDSKGALVPFQGPDGINVGVWVQFGANRVLIDPQDFAVASQVASALTAAKGVANGIPSLDSTALIPLGQMPDGVAPLVAAYQSGAIGTSMYVPVNFVLHGATSPFTPSGVAPSFAAGFTSGSTMIQQAGRITRCPFVQLNDYSTATATTVDVQVDQNDGLGFVSIFGSGPYPTIAAGTGLVSLRPTDATAPVPVVQSIAKDSLLRVATISAPAPGSSSGTGAAFIGTDGEWASTTTVVTSHVIPMPASAATGETILAVLATQAGGVTHSASSGAWTKVGEIVAQTNASPPVSVCKMSVWAATYAGGLSSTFTTSGSTASAGWSRRLTGTDPTKIDVIPGYGFNAGATFAVPAATAANAYDLLVLALADNLPSGLTGTWTQAYTSGIVTPTEEADLQSGRVGSANIGLSVNTKTAAVAQGATIPAGSVTITGGAGSGTATWMYAYIGVRRAAGTHGPTDCRVEIAVQPA